MKQIAVLLVLCLMVFGALELPGNNLLASGDPEKPGLEDFFQKFSISATNAIIGDLCKGRNWPCICYNTREKIEATLSFDNAAPVKVSEDMIIWFEISDSAAFAKFENGDRYAIVRRRPCLASQKTPDKYPMDEFGANFTLDENCYYPMWHDHPVWARFAIEYCESGKFVPLTMAKVYPVNPSQKQ